MNNELFIKGIELIGIELQAGAEERFQTYITELKKWNRAYNLTAITDDEGIIVKHFLDSLLYLKALPETAFRICDAGSGAGFPGVPMALVRPELTITLVEPSRKKCAFLRNLSRTLGLSNIAVIESRMSAVAERGFDAAVTRALFSAEEFVKEAAHLLVPGGALVLSKGPRAEEELERLPRGSRYETLFLKLPFADSTRCLIRIFPETGAVQTPSA